MVLWYKYEFLAIVYSYSMYYGLFNPQELKNKV